MTVVDHTKPRGITQDQSKKALTRVVDTFFGGSIGDAIAALVDTGRGKLSPDELRRLEGLIDEAKKEGR